MNHGWFDDDNNHGEVKSKHDRNKLSSLICDRNTTQTLLGRQNKVKQAAQTRYWCVENS